jgi:hypothetical protein
LWVGVFSSQASILQNNRIEATALVSTFAGARQIEIGDGIGLFSGASARIDGNTFRRNGRLGLILDGANGRDTAIESNSFEQATSAIILQNVAIAPPTETNTFDAPNPVQIVDAGPFGVRAEELSTR